MFASVLLLKQGEGAEPGLGEDLYNAVKNGEEMPEVYDDEPKNHSPDVIKTLIMKMTMYRASDRPTAREVMSVLKDLHAHLNANNGTSSSHDNVHPSLRLMQALTEKNQDAVDASIADPDVKHWINHHVDMNVERLGATVTEHMTCLYYASHHNNAHTVRKLVEVVT